MKASIKREGNRVWIENVTCPRWGQGRECTYMGAASSALAFIGDNVSYDDLMGWSGHAFRVQIMQPDWCPSAACAGPGFDTCAAANQAIDRELTVFAGGDADAAKVEQRRAAIVSSIDAGRPVIYSYEECGLIVGYEDRGQRFLYRTYFDKTEQVGVLEKWDWASAVVVGPQKTAPMARRQKLIRSLRLVVELFNTSSYGAYASGSRAYELWIAQLQDEARFIAGEDDASRKKLKSTMLANAYCYGGLADARAAAARYLRNVAREVDDDSASHLLNAAQFYDSMQLKLCRNRACAPYAHQLEAGQRWTAEMRQAEAALLKEAYAADRAAVVEIESALKRLDNEAR